MLSHVEQVQQDLWLRQRLTLVKTNHDLGLVCMKGTRESILNQLIAWATSNTGQNVSQSNISWVYGLPGIGKTSLAHSICASLHDRRHLAGAFFCRRDDPNLNEPRNILSTLIYKLAIRFPPFRSVVAERLREEPDLTPESMNSSFFLDLLHNLPHHPEHTLSLCR
jgi:Cdc6-like AAA superfamily ATPase